MKSTDVVEKEVNTLKISKQKIEVLMVKQGFTVKELADKIGVSRQNLSTIKNRGTCNPQTAAKICKGLSCGIEEITPTETEV
jgi:DNA-binding Xre family transcriptional regulator